MPNAKPQVNYASHYTRRGERVTHRIASAVAKKSWYWTLFNLAWTVGPVTYLALQFGHYLGFGSQAPIANFYYFAGYTLIAGACAWIASIVHEAIYKPRIDQQQEQLLEAIDTLYGAKLLARDTTLEQLDASARQVMSAYYILQSVGASPSAIEASVLDLTGSAELTSAARRAHVYCEQGMLSRVHDIYDEVKPHLQAAEEQLLVVAPQAYTLLEKRMRGVVPSVRVGIERSEGFIERVLNAAESNDTARLTSYDVEELFTLALELLSGRKIAMIGARLKGDAEFEKAQMQLDQARQQYRVALRKRNSHIRLLAEALYAQTNMELVAEAADATYALLDAIEQSVPLLPHAIQQRYRISYERVLQWNTQVASAREQVLKAEAAYAKNWRRHGEKLTLTMQKESLTQAGFYIEERYIALNDKQKLKLAEHVLRIRAESNHTQKSSDPKYMAMELANLLDELINIGKPAEQLAIESSNAADFGYITKKLTPRTKAGWATIAVDAMHENRRKASHRLARNLILFYRLPLTDAIITLFVEQFGADEAYLKELNVTLGSNAEKREAALPDPAPEITPWKKLVAAA